MKIEEFLVPKENLYIYNFLYQIEVGLRELIIDTLESSYGPRWWKSRLPAELQQPFLTGLEACRKVRWCEFVPHHPIYYLNFPDLKRIMEQKDNWRDVFQKVFGRKEVLLGTLVKLESVRNDIAHNRKISPKCIGITKNALDELKFTIGDKRFQHLVTRSTYAKDLISTLSSLKNEATWAFDAIENLEPLGNLETWEKVSNQWWFDSDYLLKSISEIVIFFEVLVQYSALPRNRGQGYKIEIWVNEQDIEKRFQGAVKEFSLLLEKSNLGEQNGS